MCTAVFINTSTGQEMHRFLPDLAAENGDNRLYVDQIKYSPLVIKAISLCPI
jgi:hypothetical protein